jgi:hypothetical protein
MTKSRPDRFRRSIASPTTEIPMAHAINVKPTKYAGMGGRVAGGVPENPARLG